MSVMGKKVGQPPVEPGSSTAGSPSVHKIQGSVGIIFTGQGTVHAFNGFRCDLYRVLSGKFPDSVKAVVYQPSQFQPVSNGTINTVKVTAETSIFPLGSQIPASAWTMRRSTW